MFYHPDRATYAVPTSLPVQVEEISFDSPDGTKLNGWFLHTKGRARGTVIHFHGNAQNLTSHVSFVQWLPEEGFNVFVFDYRGYGKSQGRPSRKGIFQDCQAAMAYVRGRSDVDPSRLLVLGQSLGGACALAALGEGDRNGVRGIVIESSFLSYQSMANSALGGTFLTKPLAWALVSDAHSPEASIKNISPIPLLVIHGDADRVVPFSNGESLFKAAGKPKEFIRVEGGDHTEALSTFGRTYRRKVRAFFERSLDGTSDYPAP